MLRGTLHVLFDVAFQDSLKVCLHPRSKAISYVGDVFPRNLKISPRRGTVISSCPERDRAALGEQNCRRVFLARHWCFRFFPRGRCTLGARELARRVLQLLATKTLVMPRLLMLDGTIVVL